MCVKNEMRVPPKHKQAIIQCKDQANVLKVRGSSKRASKRASKHHCLQKKKTTEKIGGTNTEIPLPRTCTYVDGRWWSEDDSAGTALITALLLLFVSLQFGDFLPGSFEAIQFQVKSFCVVLCLVFFPRCEIVALESLESAKKRCDETFLDQQKRKTSFPFASHRMTSHNIWTRLSQAWTL